MEPALHEKYVYARKLLTQRRKGAKRCRASKAFFASLRLCVKIFSRHKVFSTFRAKPIEPSFQQLSWKSPSA